MPDGGANLSMKDIAALAALVHGPIFPLHHTVQLPDGRWACSCHLGADCPATNMGKHPRITEW